MKNVKKLKFKIFYFNNNGLKVIIILLIGQPDLGQSILLIGSWVATVFISGVI